MTTLTDVWSGASAILCTSNYNFLKKYNTSWYRSMYHAALEQKMRLTNVKRKRRVL